MRILTIISLSFLLSSCVDFHAFAGFGKACPSAQEITAIPQDDIIELREKNASIQRLTVMGIIGCSVEVTK